MQVHFKNFGAMTAVRCGFVEGRYNYTPHIHQFPEIVYVEDGEMDVITDLGRVTMRAGDIAVLTPFLVHEFQTKSYVKRWLAVFSPDFLSGFLPTETIYGSASGFVFHASDALIGYIKPKLADSGENFYEMTDSEMRSFKLLVTAVYEEFLKNHSITDKTHQRALPAILHYISLHSGEELSLSSIGAALGYSPKYVSLCLSDIEGINLFYLINSFRAEKAKDLLVNSSLKIIDVAYECGYANEKSFYRAFLQVTGMTPGQYRKHRRTFGKPDAEPDWYHELSVRKKEEAKKKRVLRENREKAKRKASTDFSKSSESEKRNGDKK